MADRRRKDVPAACLPLAFLLLFSIQSGERMLIAAAAAAAAAAAGPSDPGILLVANLHHLPLRTAVVCT